MRVFFVSWVFAFGFLVACSSSLVSPLPDGAVRPSLVVEGAFLNASLLPGDLGSAEFLISVSDPDVVLEDGVLFVTVNRELEDGKYITHVGSDLFGFIDVSSDVFQKVISGDELRSGVPVRFNFRVNDRVPFGDYTLHFQLFHGRVVDPNDVRLWHRLGTAGFGFKVVDALP